MLLGYLMNALDEDELVRVERELLRRPKLRSELATLQKELSPLTSIDEPVDPPRHLARRTCDRLWAVVDRTEKTGHVVRPNFPESAPVVALSSAFPFDHAPVPPPAPAEVFTVLSPKVPADMASDVPARRLTRRNDRSASSEPKYRRDARTSAHARRTGARSGARGRRGRWTDILASIGVGILIAIIAFPAVNFAKNRARVLITQNKIRRFQQGTGVYAQLQRGIESPDRIEAPQGVNLTRSGWQEFDPAQFPVLLVDKAASPAPTVLRESALNPLATPTVLTPQIQPVSSHVPILAENRGRDLFLGQSPGCLNESKANPRELSYQTLLSNVDRIVLPENGSSVQTAYGQNVLFQNGRVFFRILPVFDSSDGGSAP